MKRRISGLFRVSHEIGGLIVLKQGGPDWLWEAQVAEELHSGRLVRPFELSLESDFGYFLVYPPAALARPKVKAFRDFLMQEAER